MDTVVLDWDWKCQHELFFFLSIYTDIDTSILTDGEMHIVVYTYIL